MRFLVLASGDDISDVLWTSAKFITLRLMGRALSSSGGNNALCKTACLLLFSRLWLEAIRSDGFEFIIEVLYRLLNWLVD